MTHFSSARYHLISFTTWKGFKPYETVWRLNRTPERRRQAVVVEVEVNLHLLGVIHVHKHQRPAPEILYTH